MRRITAALLVFLGLSASSLAMGPATNGLLTPKEQDKPEFAIPLGATAGLGADAEKDATAGALLGFQIATTRKESKSFVSLFFSLAPAETIRGEQKDFGAFLLNPSRAGSSFFLAGNYLWNPNHSEPKKEYYIGPSLRTGLTRSTWQATVDSTSQSVDGFVGYATLSFLVMSRTHKTAGGNSEGQSNEYEFGLEVGPTYRWIGGDLARGRSFIESPEVLGTAQTSLAGFEATFFARLNTAKPFLRLTRFKRGTSIPGFSGWQAMIGVDILSSLFRSELKD